MWEFNFGDTVIVGQNEWADRIERKGFFVYSKSGSAFVYPQPAMHRVVKKRPYIMVASGGTMFSSEIVNHCRIVLTEKIVKMLEE